MCQNLGTSKFTQVLQHLQKEASLIQKIMCNFEKMKYAKFNQICMLMLHLFTITNKQTNKKPETLISAAATARCMFQYNSPISKLIQAVISVCSTFH